ncbi:N-6 DNA Methylase [Desulfonatronum thiosulfatophilum]|uniref:N-6 DNA Methylase n=1 Tax=Desulfonatronum thiosulfatophilum TaxID=617002 RepID=A0A1G6C1E2_9BACT|nr:N-6 DNA methylase [Desulfonatronum thiosulfatophilum]SDB26655.1 N-6 DNA Methylase [Desulfonatronum thiosulfatophilum]
MSEHTEVRLPLVEKLLKLGWDKNQLQYEPEWRVPKTPSEASRREKGQSFKSFPIDVAIFDHPSHVGDYQHLQVIIETKAPTIVEGINQLEIYMSLEPHVLLGIWTNGQELILVYRTPDGKFDIEKNGSLPKPTDSLIRTAGKRLTWADLEVPTTAELKKTFSRLLDVVVSRDTLSTRRDDQLNNLCNIILAKLEGDKLAKYSPDDPAPFQVWGSEEETAKKVKALFDGMRIAHSDLFLTDSDKDIHLDDHTIHSCAYEISKYRLRDTSISVISEAFQIFRTSSLKSEEGQYYTPYPVIRSAIKLMEIKPSDKVLDPACGTGGFLLESFRQLIENHPTMSDGDTKSWANRHLFGVDKDRINVKLTKAIMLTIGDGSTNTYLGDSIRKHLWATYFQDLQTALTPRSFTCIVTNPPFGKGLKVSKVDAKAAGFTISRKPKKLPSGGFEYSKSVHEEREIGILFLERCYDLLADGGRLGIILPETYMFSPSYAWLRFWLKDRLELKGMLNIAMEAFQGFCRAKTNFYIFEKVVDKNA